MLTKVPFQAVCVGFPCLAQQPSNGLLDQILLVRMERPGDPVGEAERLAATDERDETDWRSRDR